MLYARQPLGQRIVPAVCQQHSQRRAVIAGTVLRPSQPVLGGRNVGGRKITVWIEGTGAPEQREAGIFALKLSSDIPPAVIGPGAFAVRPTGRKLPENGGAFL